MAYKIPPRWGYFICVHTTFIASIKKVIILTNMIERLPSYEEDHKPEAPYLHVVGPDEELFDPVAAHAAEVSKAWEEFARDGKPRHVRIPDNPSISSEVVRPSHHKI